MMKIDEILLMFSSLQGGALIAAVLLVLVYIFKDSIKARLARNERNFDAGVDAKAGTTKAEKEKIKKEINHLYASNHELTKLLQTSLKFTQRDVSLKLDRLDEYGQSGITGTQLIREEVKEVRLGMGEGFGKMSEGLDRLNDTMSELRKLQPGANFGRK